MTFGRTSRLALSLAIALVSAPAVANACIIQPLEKRMRAAEVVVTGSAEFSGGRGTIAVGQMIKGERSASISARFPVYCEGSLTPDARRRAVEALARSRESLRGTFYLTRDPTSASSYLVTAFVPSQEKRSK